MIVKNSSEEVLEEKSLEDATYESMLGAFDRQYWELFYADENGFTCSYAKSSVIRQIIMQKMIGGTLVSMTVIQDDDPEWDIQEWYVVITMQRKNKTDVSFIRKAAFPKEGYVLSENTLEMTSILDKCDEFVISAGKKISEGSKEEYTFEESDGDRVLLKDKDTGEVKMEYRGYANDLTWIYDQENQKTILLSAGDFVINGSQYYKGYPEDDLNFLGEVYAWFKNTSSLTEEEAMTLSNAFVSDLEKMEKEFKKTK